MLKEVHLVADNYKYRLFTSNTRKATGYFTAQIRDGMDSAKQAIFFIFTDSNTKSYKPRVCEETIWKCTYLYFLLKVVF